MRGRSDCVSPKPRRRSRVGPRPSSWRLIAARFTPKVLPLLSVYVTDMVIQKIDALFGDNDIRLGSEQPDSSDPRERRERMRRYRTTLDLNTSAGYALVSGRR
jgi:hypothetical protein